jgi:hypothetical protein
VQKAHTLIFFVLSLSHSRVTTITSSELNPFFSVRGTTRQVIFFYCNERSQEKLVDGFKRIKKILFQKTIGKSDKTNERARIMKKARLKGRKR